MFQTLGCIALLVTVPLWTRSSDRVQDVERHVFVTVLDKDGSPIEGLTPEHFAIRESGKDRAVVRVEPLRAPMHVIVLLDLGAVAGATHQTFQSDVADFLERLAGFNHVALYSFGDRVLPLTEFTQSAAQLRAAATKVAGAPGRSCLIDAIDLALREFERSETARPVIVAITTESAEASRLSAGSVIKRLISSSVAFHALSLRGSSGSSVAGRLNNDIPSSSQQVQGMIALGEGDRERERVLKQGAATTGGSLQRVTSTLAAAPALTRLAREFANAYRVTFSRPGDAGIKDLQVGIMLEGVTIRATAAPVGTR